MAYIVLTKGANYGYGDQIFVRDQPQFVTDEIFDILIEFPNFEEGEDPSEKQAIEAAKQKAAKEAEEKIQAEKAAAAEAKKAATPAKPKTEDAKPAASGATTPPQA